MAYTAIDDPSLYFQIATWTGTGSSNSITLPGDTNMQPDLSWIKSRNSTSSHCVNDSVRGVANGNTIHPNNTGAEDTSNTDAVDSFDSDGVTLGADTGNLGVNYSNSQNYVGWFWKAGTTSGKSTTGETITPSGYSINATSGFGIFAWSGTGSNGTITHGLSGDVGKGMLIVKQLNSTAGWQVYHQETTADYTIYLNSNAAADDSNTVWNDTTPTSSVFTLGTNTGTNASGSTYIGYVFAPKQGFSKFGRYKSNGNANGPFIYTGFRPAWIMFKKNAGSAGWEIMDSKRAGYNDATYKFSADANDAENTDSGRLEILSNGFKIRTTGAGLNSSSSDYLYAAFAEAPFVNSSGVPCNAR